MNELTGAMIFILLAGPVFISVIALERWWLLRQGRTEAYDVRESLANIGTGFIYKVGDALFLILAGSAAYIGVHNLGWGWSSGHVGSTLYCCLSWLISPFIGCTASCTPRATVGPAIGCITALSALTFPPLCARRRWCLLMA